MTMIDVDTSPLQAAREWRGTSLVAVARSCGLPVAQAEALEEGDTGAFASVDEMIAAAVLYGASIGIGRDEAMALLDRTVSGDGVQVQLPTRGSEASTDGFSHAVQHRSARIASRIEESSVRIPLESAALPSAASAPSALEHVMEVPVASALPTVSASTPILPHGPTPEQATAAAAEIAIETSSFSWDHPAEGGELAAWATDGAPDDASVGSIDGAASAAPGQSAGFAARAGSITYRGLERVVGGERADQAAESVERSFVRIAAAIRTGRERLRRSEHATLIVAMTGGAILVALLVAIASSLGGSDEPKVNAGNASKQAAPAPAAIDTAPAPKVVAKKPAAILPPAKVTVNVFNAGSTKGQAKVVAATLKDRGYRLGEVGNAKADYGGSVVIHPKDKLREARRVAEAAGITTMDISPGSSDAITVIVV